jgi:hypothetical protein
LPDVESPDTERRGSFLNIDVQTLFRYLINPTDQKIRPLRSVVIKCRLRSQITFERAASLDVSHKLRSFEDQVHE